MRNKLERTLVLLPTVSLLLGISVGSASAEMSVEAATAASQSMQKDLGVFVYPKGEQGAVQQVGDQIECYESAKTRTSIDPKAPPPAVNAPQAQRGGAVRGAARGAARGAVVGEVANDRAGDGAAAGAAMGAMRGAARQQQANAAAQQQAEQQAEAAQAERINTFKQAFSACMDARNYSVK